MDKRWVRGVLAILLLLVPFWGSCPFSGRGVSWGVLGTLGGCAYVPVFEEVSCRLDCVMVQILFLGIPCLECNRY